MSRFSSYIWKHSHKITNSLFHSDPGCETSSLVTFFPYSIKKKKKKEEEEDAVVEKLELRHLP
jgi:hypothetical protein